MEHSDEQQETLPEQSAEPPGESAARPKGKMYFTVREGEAETRANDVRPLGRGIRAYCLAMTVTFASLGIGAWLPVIMPFLFTAGERVPISGEYVVRAATPVIGGFYFAVYLFDCVSRCALNGMTRSQLRRRLAAAEKSARYVASPRHLRGAMFAAQLFGALAFIGFAMLVARWASGGV